MSARTLLMWGGLALLLGACGNEAAAGKSATSDSTTTTTVTPTSLVVVSTAASTTPPQAAIPEGLLDDCVSFVEFSAAQGDPFMSMLWNTSGGDKTKVLAACEAKWYVTDDANSDGVPDGQAELEMMSQKKKDLDAFFEHYSTTPPAGGAPTIPGAVVACPPGQVLTATGHCQAATP